MNNPHPNATASVFGGALGIIIVGIVNRASSTEISAEEAAALSTILGGVILLVGRIGPFRR